MPGSEPGRDDDELGVELEEAGRNSGVEVGHEELDSDDLEDLGHGLVGGRRGRQHGAAQFREGVGDGEAGDAETEDGDPQARPVRVPARQRGDALVDHGAVLESHSR